jgi:hypothetical protein
MMSGGPIWQSKGAGMRVGMGYPESPSFRPFSVLSAEKTELHRLILSLGQNRQ